VPRRDRAIPTSSGGPVAEPADVAVVGSGPGRVEKPVPVIAAPQPAKVTVVGFDLGHGETAVAVVQSDTAVAPAVVDLPGASGSGRQHVTAVAEHPTRGVLLGESAVEATLVTSLYLNFKSPRVNREEVRRPTRLLVNKIREGMAEAGIATPARPQRWVFGAPSGWDSGVRDGYARLLRTAGLDRPGVTIEVVPESRAALLYARDSGEVPVEANQLSGTVLIIDIGSSTTDFTVVTGRHLRPPVDSGTRLGANLIDKLILRWAIDHSEHRELIEKLIEEDPYERLRLELFCRRAKEQYFRADPQRWREDPDRPIPYSRPLPVDGPWKYFTFNLTAKVMDRLLATPIPELGGRSWPAAFRTDLVAVADTAPHRPDLVLLTGGASRMRFAQDIVRSLFGPGRVVIGSEPELAIARGLAIAGRISVRAAGFRSDVDSLLRGPRIGTLVEERLPDLAQAMAKAAIDGMTERHVIPAFRRWYAGSIATIDQLTDEVVAAIRRELTDPGNPRLTAGIVKWQNELRPDLDLLTRPICLRWFIPPAALSLPAARLGARPDELRLAPSTAPATAAIGNLASAIGALVFGAVATTILVSTGAGLAVSTGPLGVGIATTLVAVGLVMGREAVMAKATSANLPLVLRHLRSEQVLVQKLRDGAAQQEKELRKKLEEQFLSGSGRELVRDIAAALAGQLEAQAAEAELLIK
jgi:hypothetical protein